MRCGSPCAFPLGFAAPWPFQIAQYSRRPNILPVISLGGESGFLLQGYLHKQALRSDGDLIP